LGRHDGAGLGMDGCPVAADRAGHGLETSAVPEAPLSPRVNRGCRRQNEASLDRAPARGEGGRRAAVGAVGWVSSPAPGRSRTRRWAGTSAMSSSTCSRGRSR
jgi:hypothetical protein